MPSCIPQRICAHVAQDCRRQGLYALREVHARRRSSYSGSHVSDNRTTCPFCGVPDGEVIVENALAVARWDKYPVNVGHALVIPRRHTPTWFDATADERDSIMGLVDEVKAILDARHEPCGYNIGINVGAAGGQTVMHLHVHLIPRYDGDVPDPRGGVRYVIPHKANYLVETRPALSTGGRTDPFARHIGPHASRASGIDIIVAFAQRSGVEFLRPYLESAVERGAVVRILVSDYLNITQAQALRMLLDLQDAEDLEDEQSEHLPGTLDVRVIETESLSGIASTFHAKAWLFHSDRGGVAFVGSSNLSRAALTDGGEWNLRASPHGFAEVLSAFEEWWRRGRTLTDEWLTSYAERARATDKFLPPGEIVFDAEHAPEPRDVQADALLRLRRAREQGRDRALVVLATGLGKTWLAAFDVAQWREEQGRLPRVLFVAHRVELLRQAAYTFRRLFPDERFGWYVGSSSSLTGDVVFASVMKLGRPDNLQGITPDAFDYVIVDEVHHADARTYRRILNRLRPAFRLGLTATPERADAGDVLGLFDDFVAFEAGIGSGISLGHLVPFRYIGLADVVDYKPIPWKNRRFDPAELSAAVQTERRMERLHEAWEKHAASRTLVFCCSIAHANFASLWLSKKGIRAVSVHSGGGTYDRAEALSELQSGDLDAICTIDLFNEGIDVPAIDRVVMLRPTESPVVFLQQLGRGLRTSDGKDDLVVIDFVGNHRVFLDRVRTLLSLAPAAGEASVHTLLANDGHVELPEGCSVDVDLEAVDLLRQLLSGGVKDALVNAYRELYAARGRRPTIGEMYRLDRNPRSLKGFDGWFDFVDSEGHLEDAEREVLSRAGDWLRALEWKEKFTKSYKPVALQAVIEAEALTTGMSIADNADLALEIARRSPELVADLPQELTTQATYDPAKWRAYWVKWPLTHWKPWFRMENDDLIATFDVPQSAADALVDMTTELLDYRLARYRRRKRAAEQAEGRVFECKVISNKRDPILKLPDRTRHEWIPSGPTDIRLPDGAIWRFRFVKIAVNVAHPVGRQRNELPDLLRQWFGPDAGRPGTAFHVRFHPTPDGWGIAPADTDDARVVPLPTRGRVVAFPSLRAAAGWTPSNPDSGEADPVSVALPGEYNAGDVFAIRASGQSMQRSDWRQGIHDGDWVIMKWARGAAASVVVDRVVLIQRGEPDEGYTYHLKRLRRSDRGFALESDNPAHATLPATAEDEVIAVVAKTIRPEQLAPRDGTELRDDELAASFGLSEAPTAPWGRVDGHLFLMCENKGELARPDRVAIPVVDRRPAETAFVLVKVESGIWRYQGIGRWSEVDGTWAVLDVDFTIWRALGSGRSASRRLPEGAHARAQNFVNVLLERLERNDPWIGRSGKRCRVVGRAPKGGLRIDGGPDGFAERTVSLTDLAWALVAQDHAGSVGGMVDESMVNRLRYLDGTPKGSTRWIDTGWALLMVVS